jgi:adenosylcobinamide-GDP ribazoletransferase
MDRFHDLAAVLRFYSRLPVPRLPGEADPHRLPDFSRIAWAVPLAGALIGLTGAVTLLVADALGLPPLVSALLCLVVLVLATGAFHEDGLADTADGLGGGKSVEQKLEIMKDSRIGTYGGAALVLSLLLRAAILAELIEASAFSAALIVVAVAAVSRVAGLALATFVLPARREGAAFAAGAPSPATFGVAVALAGLVALPVMGAEVAPVGLIFACAATAAATLAMMRLAERQIGGQTGDLAGATQQVAEIAFLLVLLMFALDSDPS